MSQPVLRFGLLAEDALHVYILRPLDGVSIDNDAVAHINKSARYGSNSELIFGGAFFLYPQFSYVQELAGPGMARHEAFVSFQRGDDHQLHIPAVKHL